MKILYVGDLQQGGTCFDRMQTLAKMGFEAIPFDISVFKSAGFRLLRSYSHRFNSGPLLKPLNNNLLQFARKIDFDMVWIDKGVWIYPDTVDELRGKSSGKTAIHFTPDAQFLQHRSRHFVKSLPLYDLAVTTKPFEVEHYQRAAAQNVILVLQGFGKRFSPEMAKHRSANKLKSQLCFVGHCQRHYAKRLMAASKLDFDLRIWGANWPQFARFNDWAKPYVYGDGLWNEDYAAALASTKIGLGLLSKYIPETTTTRTFEIPASGTLLLAERTEHHLELFEEGVEAEFFSDDDELCEKVCLFVGNESLRKSIAEAGRRRCIADGYDTESQLRRIFNHLDLHPVK